MDDWAAAVLDVLPGPGIFVGASMGGYCAVAAARLAPERVAGSCSPARGPTRTRPSGARSAPRRSRSHASAARRGSGRRCAICSSPTRRDPELVAWAESVALDRTVDELVTALEAIRDRPDSTEAYRSLGDRRLTIVGDPDPFVSVEDARAFDPDAVVVPGCGHLPSLERPAEFGELVREAIARWR